MNLVSYRIVVSLIILISRTGFAVAEDQGRLLPKSANLDTAALSILNAKCSNCHNNTVQKAELDLSSLAAIRRGGESGESAISETLDDSLLWIMIDGGGMPPEGEPQLSKVELQILKSWIEQQSQLTPKFAEGHKAVDQHDVIPILLLRCAACHGAQRKDGKLDLRTAEGMASGGNSGPAFVAGDPEKSLMLQRIESEACPPSELLLKFFVKRPPESEVEVLRTWIAAGAPVAEIQPDVATTQPDPLVTDEDRQHWAFQPLNVDSQKLNIDQFITAKLSEAGLKFSSSAERETLIRRAYFDLIGLPPSVAELTKWTEATATDWYEQMIDSLLDSPRYGERWGRYWLDLAGYADSEGGVSADPLREVAWKYRDYVIRSFNEDKPYDQFLLEQIAGDELVDYRNADEVTQQMVDNLVATGFLRMGIDQTGSRTMNFVPERLGVIDDALNVLGSSVMGLTIECARCHTHKYDAIPHRDYYRLKAVFQGAFDEHDWLSFKTRKLELSTPEHRALAEEVNPPLLKQLTNLEKQLKSTERERQLELLRSHYPEQTEEDRLETIRSLSIADNNRTLVQRNLVEKLQRVEILPPNVHPKSVQLLVRQTAELRTQIKLLKKELVPSRTIRALWDRGNPSPTYILHRGEHNKPGRLVGPGVPSVLTDGQTSFEVSARFTDGNRTTGRRLAFAKWLTDGNHALTARVMVNRVWFHHFGRGIVESLENFGVQGAKPSHLELLDWLASSFIDNGWSVKEVHRLIMNSQTYRQQSVVTEQHLQLDPQNILLSRMPLRRVNAEALRDSLLFVSDKLDLTMFGPPDSVSVDREGEVSVDSTPAGKWRRSVYVQYRRTEIPSMMATFDYPEMGPNCVSRHTSIVSPQSLMLMNNDRVRQLAGSLADRIIEEAARATQVERINLLYLTTLSREPNEEEMRIGRESLEVLLSEFDQDELQAWTVYCHTIFNSAAFSYVD